MHTVHNIPFPPELYPTKLNPSNPISLITRYLIQVIFPSDLSTKGAGVRQGGAINFLSGHVPPGANFPKTPLLASTATNRQIAVSHQRRHIAHLSL